MLRTCGVISLLTDFGTNDVYVGQMKAVIAGVHPGAAVIDLSHGVRPQDIVEAAFLLAGSWRLFPAGTVHVVVVDPGVGSGRKILAAEAGGHYFIAPDNGVLELVFESVSRDAVGGEAGTVKVYSVENPQFRLLEVSATFHGRDIMAPAAANLARGTDLEILGPRVYERVSLEIPRPVYDTASGKLTGEVMFVDRFGNLVTNIAEHELKKHFPSRPSGEFRVEIIDEKISGLSRTYSDGRAGQLLALIGSIGLLEIACNLGNAADHLCSGVAEKVHVL